MCGHTPSIQAIGSRFERAGGRDRNPVQEQREKPPEGGGGEPTKGDIK
jgi:hypothetical protein